ncbi:UxaA family hydrolase [Desulfobacula sp.]|uniref:UxaA family hydrolase n=1 Tax=Desulfobacula sp. TaxID=2593537 RepID=UPI0027153207|nr:UxaA family hydrolase [Desulfobacula sp.]
MSNPKIMAYRRENGRVGIRNHVVILPLDDLSNAASENVAHNIKGCKALPHAYGRLQFGKDLELFFRTLIGTGANPNVAAVVVIGIEPEWTNIIVEGIAKTGKPVTGFSIERHGDIKTVEMASWKAKEYVHWASELQKEECDLSEIWVSTKCGESDTTSGLASNPTVGNAFEKLVNMGSTCSFGETSEITGAEDTVKEKAKTPEAAQQFMDFFDRYAAMIDRNKTDDLSGSQPTKGNIVGGLTTIEEKAFGNVQKIGKTINYEGALDKAVTPTGPGLWYMDSSSAAAEAVTLWAAAGFVAHFFPTGQGNIIGNPIEPVIKLTANPRTASDMSEHIDYDCSGILRGNMTLDESGDNLIKLLIHTCEGRLTSQEILGHEEFVLTKLYESA